MKHRVFYVKFKFQGFANSRSVVDVVVVAWNKFMYRNNHYYNIDNTLESR